MNDTSETAPSNSRNRMKDQENADTLKISHRFGCGDSDVTMSKMMPGSSPVGAHYSWVFATRLSSSLILYDYCTHGD